MGIYRITNWFTRTPQVLGLIVLLTIAAGCSHNDYAAPAVLPAAQLAPALQKAFSSAKPDIQNLTGEIIASLSKPDYSSAYLGLQKLTTVAGLSKAQARVLASELMTVNQLLQSAQSQGNQQAAQALQYHRATK